MEDLGQHLAREMRFARGLEHHRAARRDGGEDFDGDLIDRPVPGRDEPADADRLLDDHRRAAQFLEPELLEHLDRGLEMAGAEEDVEAVGERGGRAHFLHHGRAEIGLAPLIFGQDRLQQIQAFLTAGLRPAGEGLARGLDRTIHIRGAAERDPSRHPFGGRIDGLMDLVLDRIDPLPVDVKFQIFADSAILGFLKGFGLRAHDSALPS